MHWDADSRDLSFTEVTEGCNPGSLRLLESAWLMQTDGGCPGKATAASSSRVSVLRAWNWKSNAYLQLPKTPLRFRLQALDPQAGRLLRIRDDGLVVFYKRKLRPAKGDAFQKENSFRISGLRVGSTRVPLGVDPYLRFAAIWDWKDYYLQIHELKTGRMLHRSDFYIPSAQQGRAVLSFSPDGKMYFDGKRVRSLADGRVLASLPRRACCILRRAVWSADSRHLAFLIENDPAYWRDPAYQSYFPMELPVPFFQNNTSNLSNPKGNLPTPKTSYTSCIEVFRLSRSKPYLRKAFSREFREAISELTFATESAMIYSNKQGRIAMLGFE